MPVCIREHGELCGYTSILSELLLPSVLMPFEQKIYEAVFFQCVVCGVLNGTEKPAEGSGISGGPKGIWLSNTPRRKEDVKNK
jgi:hypothetical protein